MKKKNRKIRNLENKIKELNDQCNELEKKNDELIMENNDFINNNNISNKYSTSINTRKVIYKDEDTNTIKDLNNEKIEEIIIKNKEKEKEKEQEQQENNNINDKTNIELNNDIKEGEFNITDISNEE